MQAMTYKIRKRENVTLYLASEVIELDPNDFRNLKENPYTGDSQEEFLSYINNLNLDFDDAPEELDYDVQDGLNKLGQNIKWTEFGSSAEKGSDTWYELGEDIKSYRRTGGFDIHCSTSA
jgi:hypothetical protein